VKTQLMTSAHARRIATCGPLVLVAALVVSGATLGSGTDSEPIDAAAQAAWLADHFGCEHGAEMTEAVAIDAAAQAAWLADHFGCEHGAEMTEAVAIDAAAQAAWLADHFGCEHGAEMTEA
jgi:pheromone shutdown protein TraB